MRRDELDLETRTWILPGSRTKNGFPHSVPLSTLAVGIVKQVLENAGGSPFVFPSGAGVRCLQWQLPGPLAGLKRGSALRTGLHTILGEPQSPAWPGSVSRRLCWAMSRTIGPRRRRASRSASTHITIMRAKKREALDLWAGRLSAMFRAQARKASP